MTEINGQDYGFDNNEEKEKETYVVSGEQFLGGEFNRFNLSNLTAAMLGNDKYTEVYIETLSGNTYMLKENMDSGMWELVNGKTHVVSEIDRKELEGGILELGQPFRFGTIGTTTPLTKITAINANRQYTKDYLQKMGPQTDIRERFGAMMKQGKK